MSNESISFPTRCAHCHAQIDSPVVCEACNTLQPVGEQADAFELLQLPVSYDLDLDRLEEVYLHLTRMVHPDYFGESAGPQKSLSEDLSARINNAYRTLKDPLRRSEYLLRRAGGKSATEDKRVPPRLLAEVLTLREEIEEARASGASGDLAALNGRLNERAAREFQALAELHARLDAAQSAAADATVASLLGDIRQALNAVRYLQGLIRESTV